MAQVLAARGVACVQYVERRGQHERGLVDEHFVFMPLSQAQRFAARSGVATGFVDTARLVPTRTLLEGLETTRDFRAAHASATAAARDALGAACAVDHGLPASVQHPATASELRDRVDLRGTSVAARCTWTRNNPALPFGTSMLSPHLHFGMLATWHALRVVAAAGRPSREAWKFFDELLTWRDWSHYRAFHTPRIHRYCGLPLSVGWPGRGR